MLLALATCPPCVRILSVLCPPCVVGFGRASSPCPLLVRMCPPLVRHLSALCCWIGPRLQSLSATCPPLVRHLSAFSALCPCCVAGFGRASSHQSLSATCPPCHLSDTCPPLVRLVLLALAAPPVSSPCLPLVRHVSATPTLVRYLSALCCWLWPRLQSLSATCPPCVRLVPACGCFQTFYFPKQFIVGFSLGRRTLTMPWPRPQSLSGMCPASCPLWPPLQALSAMYNVYPCLLFAMCPPCVGHVSKIYPPCVRLASTLAASPNLVCHVSALPFVYHVST